MNEAHVSPEQRVVKVVKQNEVKADQSGTRASQLKTSADQMGENAAAIEAVQARLRSQLSEVSQLQEVRGRLDKLSAGLTGKTKQEKKQVDNLQKELKGKEAEAEKIRLKETAERTSMEKEEKTASHSSTVVEANKRNVTKHEEGKGEKAKPWEERVVPIKATSSLKDALKGQDILAEQIKFYSEHNYSAEPKYTLPIEQVRNLRQRLVEYQHRKSNTPLNDIDTKLLQNADKERQLESLSLGPNLKDEQKATYQRQLEEARGILESNQKKREQLIIQASKEADTQIIGVMPFYEAAVKYSEEKGAKVDIKQFADGVLQGLDIFVDNQTIGTHIFEKQGQKNVNSMTAGYYGAGASRFDERFNNFRGGDVTTENKIAYEIGYCAGAVVDKSSMHLAQHLRQWLAETVPVSDGKGGVTTLGFGYFVNRNAYEILSKGTSDLKEAEALNEAVKITSTIDKGLKDHRLFHESDRYLASLSRSDVFDEVKILS